MKDISDYLTDSGHHSDSPCWWNYEFPSGRGANVWLGDTAFTFDMEVDDGDGGSEEFRGLTTEQVRERLNTLMAEPAEVPA